MHKAVIIAALRTPLGAYRGGLRDVPATDLGGLVAKEVLHRSGVPASDVDEAIFGNVLGAGLGQNPARQVATLAGVPFSSSALTIDMVCGSGLRAVSLAAQAVVLGESSVVIAGGTENMSRAPRILTHADQFRKAISTVKHDGLRCAFTDKPMGMAAEWLAGKYGISREEQDRYALSSQRKATASVVKGIFDSETVPVQRDGGGETGQTFDRDECPRPNCSMEKLSLLRPAFKRDGTVTAGNSTPISDGAAAVLVTSESYAAEMGLPPLAHIVSWCTVGVDPRATFTAPIPAVRKILSQCGLTTNDVDIYEINDSFAVQGVVCERELGLDSERVNIRGGTLAVGHPLGASGCRILVTLLHTLKGEGKRRGLAVICLGGGNAVAMLVENAAGS